MFAKLMPQEPRFFEMFAALAISCQAAMGLGTLFGGWRIVWAWILTIPCSTFIAGVAWYVGQTFL